MSKLAPFLFFIFLANSADALSNEGRALSASNIPLKQFVENSFPELDFTISKHLGNYVVNGLYEGDQHSILKQLANQFKFAHQISDDAAKFWLDKNSTLNTEYVFSVHDMPLVNFAEQLASLSLRYLDFDTSIKATINGTYKGNLKNLAEELSLSHSLLININEDSLSIVSEDRYVENTFDFPFSFTQSSWYKESSKLITPIGNFIKLDDSTFTVGGHPRFVSSHTIAFQQALQQSMEDSYNNSTIAAVAPLIPPIIIKDSSAAVSVKPKATTFAPIKTKSSAVKKASASQRSDPFWQLEQLPGFYDN